MSSNLPFKECEKCGRPYKGIWKRSGIFYCYRCYRSKMSSIAITPYYVKKLGLLVIISFICLNFISAYKWEQRISMNMVDQFSTSTTYAPVEIASGGMGEVDITKYSNISEIYFESTAEFDFTGVPNGIGGCSLRLYDTTNNLEINESEFSISGSSIVRRSKNLTYIFNQTSPMVVMTQAKAELDSICKVYHGSVVIVQNGKISKTRTMIPMGASLAESDACSNPDFIVEPKYWNWSSNDFVSTNISFAVTQTSTDATSQSRIILVNKTHNVTQLTSTALSTDYRYYNSTNINLNMSNSTYTLRLCKLFGIGSGSMRNAFLVVDQDGIDVTNPKTVAMYQTEVERRSTSSQTPDDEDNQSEFFNTTNWDGVNFNPVSEYVIQNTNLSGAVFVRMKKGSMPIDESNLSLIASTYNITRSSIWNEVYFLNNDFLQAEIWQNNSGTSTSISSARLIFFINGLKCWYYDSINRRLVLGSGCVFPLVGGVTET